MTKPCENEILSGRRALIEASAGTGKTYTIQNLYLRMIAGWFDEKTGAERFLRVNEILVMTFTKAATEELKERIRKIIALANLFFENPDALKDEDRERLEELLSDSLSLPLESSSCTRGQTVRTRIRNALLTFDDAAIFTIHGFCERLLSQYAFESGLLFAPEIRQDEKDIVTLLLNDYRRSLLYQQDDPQLAVLRKKAISDASGWIETLTGERMKRPDLRIEGWPGQPREDLEKEYIRLLEELKSKYEPGLINKFIDKAYYEDQVLLEWQEKPETFADENVLAILSKICDKIPDKIKPEVLAHPFAEVCGELKRVDLEYRAGFAVDASLYAMNEFRKLKQQDNFLTFNDMLKDVWKAVNEPGNPLTDLVRKQFGAAVVDEFQDTDPVQYQIFKKIFGESDSGHILFFVGDPKQAIYSFRGGDTATYQQARRFIEKNGRKYTLDRNFRSAPALLGSVNSLFENWPGDKPELKSDSVFADPAVTFQHVSSGKKEKDRLGLIDASGAEDPKPLKFRWLIGADPDRNVLKLNDACRQAVISCAEDIAVLLNSDWRNPKTKKTVRPNEIAVLVPENKDAVLVRAELKKRNIPCVIPKSENVFRSAAARYLKNVLRAIISPADSTLIAQAMLTPLLGVGLEELIEQHAKSQTDENSDAMNAVREKMWNLSALWQKNSFLKMFQEMLQVFDVRSCLLSRPDGERILTDLLQIRDLLQQKVSENRLSPAAVAGYLAEQEKGQDSEEKETMMETDREAVVITTIHRSKGLEYPVVFLPLMFKRSYSCRDGSLYCYHDPQLRLTLNFKPDGAALECIGREMKQEQMRLLYVALTRAEYSCYLYWGKITNNKSSEPYDHTSLDWLLPDLSGRDVRDEAGLHISQLEPCEVKIVSANCKKITLWKPKTDLAVPMALPEWKGSIDHNYHFTSFTGLAGGNDTSGGLDHDDDEYDKLPEKLEGIFKIPPGAQTGNAWHDIMEELDFTLFDPDDEQMRSAIEQKMSVSGVLNKRTVPELCREYVTLTCRMIGDLLDTQLKDIEGKEFRLRDIKRTERLSELKFNYRFRKKTQTADLTRPSLLTRHVKEVFGLDADEMTIREMTISGGFLNGALDLLFRHNGKLYIADWKSNRISGNPDGFDDAGLKEEMAGHSYYLQYLIYTLATVKYLELHLHRAVSKADYDELFGGVFYFFMRGIDRQKPGQGVFFDRPDYDLVKYLDDLIG